MSMRIERSSVDQVKARFALNKKKLEEKKKDYDLEQRTTEMREEEEKLREYRREKKKDKKRKMEDDYSGNVEKILKGSLDSIPSASVKIQIIGEKVCLRCKGKTQQCFALLPQVNFPTNNLNFH